MMDILTGIEIKLNTPLTEGASDLDISDLENTDIDTFGKSLTSAPELIDIPNL